jgi:type I restriction enzyme R subunit
MYAKLDEEHYVENPFLAQLQRLGWKIYRQNKDNPEDVKEIIEFNDLMEPIYRSSVKFRESFREVILEKELRESIKKINPWIEDDQISEVIRRITIPQTNSLLEINREIHYLLTENTSVQENRRTGEKSPTVKFIDLGTQKITLLLQSHNLKSISQEQKNISSPILFFLSTAYL